MRVRRRVARGAAWSCLIGAPCLVGVLLLLSAQPAAQAQEQQTPAVARGASGGAAASGTGDATRSRPTARARAPFDITGYWVSLVTQNWRYRMIVPGHGDYAGIPINAKAKEFADSWQPATDIAADKQCEAYGAPALMQDPERLHILWQDDETLRVDTDEGMQTRLLRFGSAASSHDVSEGHPAPSLQGDSRARWALSAVANSLNRAAQPNAKLYGSLVVSTDDLTPGLLRKNGIPYGADAKMIEYWKLHSLGANQWLLISTKLTDPEYLAAPYVYDSIFQKEADGSRWDPIPCSLTS